MILRDAAAANARKAHRSGAFERWRKSTNREEYQASEDGYRL
jgi:hypothetical protein